MLKIRTIVVPTDFSEHAEQALAHALDLAGELSARIHLVHVWKLPRPSGGMWGASFAVELAKEMERDANEGLEETRRKVAERGAAVTAELLSGEASPQILACAKREQADLIVMGTRGHSGLPHLLLGSVAERTVRHAACPVMTVGPISERSAR